MKCGRYVLEAVIHRAVLLSTAQFGACQDQGVATVTGCWCWVKMCLPIKEH